MNILGRKRLWRNDKEKWKASKWTTRGISWTRINGFAIRTSGNDKIIPGDKMVKKIMVKRQVHEKMVQEMKSFGSVRYDTGQAIYILLTGKSFRGPKGKLFATIMKIMKKSATGNVI